MNVLKLHFNSSLRCTCTIHHTDLNTCQESNDDNNSNAANSKFPLPTLLAHLVGNLVMGRAQKDEPVPSLSFGNQSLSKTTRDSLGLSEKVKSDR